MTNKEQLAAIRAKVLVARLRRRDPFPSWEYMYDDAADEIERLAKELTELKATFRAAAIELGDPRARQQHPERQKKF